ncbi:D-2-hydroxyacid dehydrogenase family protein [Paenibacillus radicis (ex Xue et al. 2023)]|uniref:D-2-hydroxyacid dehydrogenase family protein n=1 Tax=Paenibacillus radicis (ex Xue et al. 2023) TaxID=2972489 RepID=A0ABT1YKM7_9BACL|nr:D-2-hydroxyacid dehydrogenase family protein [Paenibacillus radicis (ex Xue et al. 2023)]MCR8633731.1 D-2-hydroxyacid dehydrogenase family protein [Paenibacillus radicis (ex Xue et al. 2023)]
MKLRCAILDDYQHAAQTMADWTSISDRVEIETFHQHLDNEDELVGVIHDFDIIIIMRERTPFRAQLLARLPRLKLLITTGMRNASIDLAAAASHGVDVCGTSGGGDPTTELTWALILGLCRNIVQEHNAIRSNGPWQSSIGSDLRGKRLGLLGLGKLGGNVARIGQAFGMEVIAWSQNLTKERAEEVGVQLASSKEEVLESSDIVSIHLVLSERTRGLLGAEELRMMRPSAYLINTSRAPIVDQTALVEALQNQWIAGAGLDVFEIEPLPADSAFRQLPNVLTTPHLGYVSRANYQTYYREAVEDIEAFLSGSPIRKLS